MIGATTFIVGLWILASPLISGATGFVAATYAVKIPSLPSTQFTIQNVAFGVVITAVGYFLMGIKGGKKDK